VTAAREPSFGAEEGRVYGEALDALDRAGVRYMLGGAFALNAYTGIWRDTKDLDVFAPREALPGIFEALEEAGFETEITDPCWLAKARKGDFFLDIIHADDNGINPVEESWYAHAVETSVLGRRVLAIPAEEMILSKMFVAYRDRWDISDILHLIFTTRGKLDWDRVLAGAGEHWELLLAYLHLYRYVYPSHAGYVPRELLDLLTGRYEREVESPSREPLRFRGTLLDYESFRVDVEDWGLPDERAAAREVRCPEGEGG
jgi:hypothetical protein